ncbi:group III truncated hemoglobin [Marinoscillum pacificum]|uniref:group III truncated hemoglobin n=1 Tax=Marinoscillum pacificum TaxID=392723 RepID=UPI002158099F|nr:group III truncated hemoglobin [Marinoscillum pacificum]
MKARIESEFEIEMLIDTFYEKVLEHEELSYFFSEAVMNWEFHKQMFIKYWSKQILFTDSYEGSPLHRHIEVDHRFGRSFTKYHFEEWARLWVETIDILFEGDKAELAKESGVNMAKNIHLKMYVNRKPEPLYG